MYGMASYRNAFRYSLFLLHLLLHEGQLSYLLLLVRSRFQFIKNEEFLPTNSQILKGKSICNLMKKGDHLFTPENTFITGADGVEKEKAILPFRMVHNKLFFTLGLKWHEVKVVVNDHLRYNKVWGICSSTTRKVPAPFFNLSIYHCLLHMR